MSARGFVCFEEGLRRVCERLRNLKLGRGVLVAMRLGHIELFCRDCFATQAFYTDILGFETTEVQGGQFVWLRSEDGLEILLRPGKDYRAVGCYRQSGQAFVVYCDDLEHFHDRLVRAKVSIGEPGEEPDCLTFRDPDGRWLQAVEHV